MSPGSPIFSTYTGTLKRSGSLGTRLGKGGKPNNQKLPITAQVTLNITADGKSVSAPLFVEPDSDQQCLFGMNVVPLLGLKFTRSNGQPLAAVEAKAYGQQTFKDMDTAQRHWIMKRVSLYTGLIGGSMGCIHFKSSQSVISITDTGQTIFKEEGKCM